MNKEKSCSSLTGDPVFFNCCASTIYKDHIDSILSSIDTSEKAICPFCNAEIQSQTFQKIKSLKSPNEKLEPKFEITLNNFKDKINYMEKIRNDPDIIIYEKISEFKRQVDLDKEKLKEKIDELSGEIIQKQESLEIRCKQNV